MAVIGHDSEIIDEPIPPDAALFASRPHLLSTSATNATPVVTNRADTGVSALDAQLEVLLSGGAPEVVVQGYGGSLPTLAQARDLLPAGSGTVIAPEAVTSTDHIALAPSLWSAKKVVLLNGPSGASDSALTTLSAADIAGGDLRGGGLWADWATYRKTVGTVNAPATLGIAAAICRNGADSGQAAGGKWGVLQGAISIVGGPRNGASRDTLSNAQVNTCVMYGTEVRGYAFFSLANPTTLPHWVQLQSARVVADYRARAAGLTEQTLFDKGSADRRAIERAIGERLAVLLEMWREDGSLYGATPAEAFSVVDRTSEADLAAGTVRLRTRIKVAPHIQHVVDSISNRPISAGV